MVSSTFSSSSMFLLSLHSSCSYSITMVLLQISEALMSLKYMWMVSLTCPMSTYPNILANS